MRKIIIAVLFLVPFGSSNAENVYIYMNSLVDHASTDPALGADDDTKVPNWVGRIAAVGGDTFQVDGEFGFVNGWLMPPRADRNYTDATTSGITLSSWASVEASNLTRMYLTPDNFTLRLLNHDDGVHGGANYATRFVAMIDEWETQVTDNLKYRIYEGWVAGDQLVPDPVSGTTTVQFDAYKADTVGRHHDQWVNIVADMKALRPALDIELVPINTAVFNTIEAIPALDAIAFDTWFVDQAPHGTETFYFLAGMAFYIDLYRKRVPSGYTPPAGAGVHATVTSNLQAIKDRLYTELIGGFKAIRIGSPVRIGGLPVRL